MNYKKRDVPTLNKTLSIAEITDNSLVVSVDGQLKVLECDVSIIKKFFALINEGISFKELEENFEDEYGIEIVTSFILHLLKEGIIEVTQKLDGERVNEKVKVAVIGSGELLSRIQIVFKKELQVVCSLTIDNYLENPFFDCETVIIVPDAANYGQLLKLNKILVKNELPFIFMYFNGEVLTLGPYVFPWKTPCFECHQTHHIRNLNLQTNNVIKLEDLNQLQITHPLVERYSDEQLQMGALLISKDIQKNLLNNQEFEFVKSEKTLKVDQNNFTDVKIYFPISDCSCCNGMNKKFRLFSHDNVDLKNVNSNMESTKISYISGGFRSKTSDETRSILLNAFNHVGLDIEINLLDYNPFSKVLSVYDSKVKETHKNKTPYFIKKEISHGKGLNKEQAYFSAAFELFERISSRYYGEIEIIRGSSKEVTPYAVDIGSIAQQVYNSNTPYDVFKLEEAVDWVWGKSLVSSEKKLVPASMVFLTSAVFKGKFFNNTSSGLSAGATVKDAILQGLLELVEHDGWLIGQANPIILPELDTRFIRNKRLLSVIRNIKSLGYKVISRDYTTDIGVPVIRSWIVNPSNYTTYATNGFGASIDPEIALERSITEAVQSAVKQPPEAITHYGCSNMRDAIYSRDSLYGLYYFQQKDIKTSKEKKRLETLKTDVIDTVEKAIQYVVKCIRKVNPTADIVYVNLTRESFGIPVVRVIVTGDIQRLSVPLITVSERLLNFQKNMGYSNRIPTYKELYMGPYPH